MADKMETYRAFLDARDCAEQLLMSHALVDERAAGFHHREALKFLAKTAEHLGFDMIPREQKQEAA